MFESELKKKFVKYLGTFTVFDEQMPDYYIALDPSHHVSLIDLTKYPRKGTWEKITLGEMPISKGYALNGRFGFNVRYIQAAREVLNPKQYFIISVKNENQEEMKQLLEQLGDKLTDIHKFQDVLHFKRGDYGVIIAPRIFKRTLKPNENKLEGFDICDFNKLLKKSASSVMNW